MKRIITAIIGVAVSAAALLPALTSAAAGPNLIANPGLETVVSGQPASWVKNNWGTNTSAFTYETTGHTGGRSVSVKISNYKTGDAKWSFAPVNVTPGTKYTFSNWYKSTAASGIDAVVTTTSNTTQYVYIASPAASAGWKQQSFSFTAPANAKAVTFYHYLEGNGTLTVDDYSLTADDAAPTPPPTPTPTPIPAPTPTPPPVTGNIIGNPSVETSAGTQPAGWAANSWGTNTSSLTYETTGQDGGRSLKATVASYSSGDAKWAFAPVAVTSGKIYNYSEYYKSNVDTEVDAEVTMADGSVQYFWLGNLGANANWTKVNLQFTAPANAAKVTIFHAIAKVGYVQTDNFSLTEYAPAKLSRGLVTLTFDDGWRSIYTNGLPALTKYGFPSTQYLNSQSIVDGYPDYMTYAMVKDFRAKGHELAWHTRSHVDVTTLTAAQLNTELTVPANFLTGTGTTTATYKHFATPFGAYNASSVSAIRAKYASHRSTDVGFNTKDNFTLDNIKVQNITNTTTAADVKAWVDKAMADKSWLVIVYHEVDTAAEDIQYSTTPALIDAQFNSIKQSGVTVKTLDQAIAEIKSQL